jgi:metallo-beta-lactamase family protein
MIRVSLCGAAGEVTGSGYLVGTPKAQVLVDFGVFQGDPEARLRSRSLGPVDPRQLEAVVLTHAHIDHSGRLPLLLSDGFRGSLYATDATLDLTEILLADLAKIEEADTLKENRMRRRAGKEPIEPLYTLEDVDRLHARARSLHYEKSQSIAPGVDARLFEAGHILGSTSVELTITDGNRKRVVVFSGDIGPCSAPILRDPVRPQAADLVFIESTYGNRNRPPMEETVAAFKEILKRAVRRKERVLIPAFAVGRTQNILFYVAEAIREGTIPEFPIYLDSPMATRATRAYAKHKELYDEESSELAKRHQIQADLRSLRIVESVEESKRLNDSNETCMIISASGMCEGGRVVHHLRHTLWRSNAHVILPGYMAKGTLGRVLSEGAQEVEIFGEKVAVHAAIHHLDGFSAHAGQSELLDWLSDVAPLRPRTVITHGEDESRDALHKCILERYNIDAVCPKIEDVIELS